MKSKAHTSLNMQALSNAGVHKWDFDGLPSLKVPQLNTQN